MTGRRYIDVNAHILPVRYIEAVQKLVPDPPRMLQRATQIPVMSSVSARIELMDRFDGYEQLPSLSSPPLETFASEEGAQSLARIANECLADMCREHPQRFPGFVATIPCLDPVAMLNEATYAIGQLGAWGVQIFTNRNGEAIDTPAYFELFDLMERAGGIIWLHPARSMFHADYINEEFSRFEIWWALGWIYETSAAMLRLVGSGVFERYPKLIIITHHAGAMMPMLEGRLGLGMKAYGTRMPEAFYKDDPPRSESLLDSLRNFYVDTASFGSRSALEACQAFFGPEKMLFATDMPYDPEGGSAYIRETLRALDQMHLPEDVHDAIASDNILRIHGAKATQSLQKLL